MGMKAQVWWIRNNGFDGPAKGGARLWDSRRRESRRRGEELFRHDVDNFELCVHNLLAAPGSNKRKVCRGRGKYGHHGRTCGFGTTKNGAHKRGRRTLNPGYEGNQKPLHLKTPKLLPSQRDSMKQDPYTPISLAILNMCDDGDEVDYMELFVRGLPVPSRKRFDRVKIKASETDEFTVKNLTVLAHAFEPAAREKIEENGGRCIRLSDVGSLPIDEKWMSTNEFQVGGDSKEDAAEAAEEKASEE
ncbi:rplO1 [Symbiodinium natans]|uniref:RplO1 protein n=1 Tax=Symbiodinium natans TaxID=878477 RepID=A0A812L4Z2_9DINO|nr:rplO1 [Symbiodinium natans]